MKILCVIDCLRSGGAQRQLVNLALNFKKDGHDVSFLTYRESSFYHTTLNSNNIEEYTINDSNYLIRLVKMRKHIRTGNYDTVISFLQASNFICEFATIPYKSWKLIVGERSANPNIYKSFKLRFYRYFHFFADFVVSNSKSNLKIVKDVNPFISTDKLKVIYNSLDLMYWCPESTPKITDVINSDKFIIAVAATHLHVKNLNVLIEAVKLLPKIFREKLLINWYGDGTNTPYKDSSYPEGILKIKKYGLENNFNFYPATNDIKSAYYNSDAIGLFSFYEGFPNTICEAMACGKPIICSKISDITLIFENHDLLFDPKSPGDLSDKLMNLMKLSEQNLLRIGSQNRALAEMYFDENNVVNQYYRLMK